MKLEKAVEKVGQVKSTSLSIDKMADGKDPRLIQMNQLSKAYHTTIKERIGNRILFYRDMLQITVRSNAVLFSLDGDIPEEIS